MSIRVLQPGLMDTIQDLGRYGSQHLGINPGGAMDRIAVRAVNALVGNKPEEGVLEMHFPASSFLFESGTVIALSGGDFTAMIDGRVLPLNKPVLVAAQALLYFKGPVSGARCYMAVRGGFDIQPWMGSYSTHLKAAAGGFQGRALQKNDQLPLRQRANFTKLLDHKDFKILPWMIYTQNMYTTTNLRITAGSEFTSLSDPEQLLTHDFSCTKHCDRMGYRLEGLALKHYRAGELLSSGVTRGAIQLMPDGQMIILTADHQTTGGYPRIAHVIAADLPSLAQHRPMQAVRFTLVSVNDAVQLHHDQLQRLQLLGNACTLQLEKWLQAYALY
ncbi:biotin-dependent carboxyltransferase family protein [Chitinophaga horti]|uniref:Biotin-dependent carboxyltransferase family protein n=1 Tax=Chitinophaga horti TaxID=2920382 RepID=A0ABY6J6L3_9BACT|nr:biotin-dependent carboxyltransferase family protein [Chitinophaga horti]UYQ95318.1 biotin-dependent carboxyltransferase family protein [Chitinophaga horti]